MSYKQKQVALHYAPDGGFDMMAAALDAFTETGPVERVLK